MFEILVYLYETYYRPETCPDSVVLAKTLSAVGFEDGEIVEALDWLRALADTTNRIARNEVPEFTNASQDAALGFRIYTHEEEAVLGAEAIGFIQYLQNMNLLNLQQREVVIDRAMAINEAPVPLGKLKVIVLMLLWSQGCESEMLMLDEFLLSEEQDDTRQLH